MLTYAVRQSEPGREPGPSWQKEDTLDLGSWTFPLIIVAFIGIFYFMAIRPQQKQRRAHQELLNTLKKGDQVMTAAGIYGTVKRVEDTVVVIEIAKGVSMKVTRKAIADIIRDTAQAKAVAPEGGSTGSGGRGRSRSTKSESSAEIESGSSDESEE